MFGNLRHRYGVVSFKDFFEIDCLSDSNIPDPQQGLAPLLSHGAACHIIKPRQCSSEARLVGMSCIMPVTPSGWTNMMRINPIPSPAMITVGSDPSTMMTARGSESGH